MNTTDTPRGTPKSLATPSEFIHQADSRLRGLKISLIARVSSKSQKANLPAQKEVLDQFCAKHGCEVVFRVAFVESGHSPDRPKMAKALKKSRTQGAEAVLLFCVNRLARDETGDEPDDWDVLRLQKVADGIPFFTILHPDLPPNQVRAEQTKLGREYRKRHSRQGPKKVKRLAKIDQALKLFKGGKTYRQIGEILGVHFTTVYGWIHKKLIQNHSTGNVP